jgi:phosphate transport system substrate-binding protein
MSTLLQRTAFVLALCALAPAPACTAQAPDDLHGTLRIAGTDTMKDLMDRWSAEFTRRHPDVHIELAAKGALTAAPALSSGTADLVSLGRELTPPELAAFRATHDHEPTGLRVALGSYDTSGKTVALAFFVNAANPIAKLSFQQLDAIYCTSLRRGATQPVTRWGQTGLGGEWAAREIHPIGVNFPDGISNFIRLRVCAGGELRSDLRTEHTGGPVNVLQRIVQDVAADSAAIGYAGFANLEPGAKIVAISEDGSPYLSGTRAEVAAAQYPLTRFIYLYFDPKPGAPLSPLAGAFLRFVESPQGQALVATDGVYMPLPTAMARAELQHLQPQEAPPQKESLIAPTDPGLPQFTAGTPLSGHLTSIGTDTMDDLMKLWIAGFHSFQPQVAIDVQSRASISVPAALTSGAAQLSPLSRELNPAEIEAFRAKHGYPPTEIAVALGSYRTPTRTVALTFYVNDANPTTRLDLQQLQAIWCASPHEAATWGDLGLRGEWATRPIHLVGVLPPDGVPNFISRRICNGDPLREGIFGEKNGGATSVLTRIVEDVAKDPAAIGYAGFHNVQPGTHAVALGRSAAGPFYTGTFDQVRTAVYPLTRFVYLYVDHAPGTPLPPALHEFLRYVLSFQGQRQVQEEGIFMPLPANVAAQQMEKLQ